MFFLQMWKKQPHFTETFVVKYLGNEKFHVCLYRDGVEVILTKAKTEKTFPNRELYGYGYDAYLIAQAQAELQAET